MLFTDEELARYDYQVMQSVRALNVTLTNARRVPAIGHFKYAERRKCVNRQFRALRATVDSATWLTVLCRAQYYVPTLRWPLYARLRSADMWLRGMVLEYHDDTVALVAIQEADMPQLVEWCEEYAMFFRTIRAVLHHIRMVMSGSVQLCQVDRAASTPPASNVVTEDAVAASTPGTWSGRGAALPILLPDVAFIRMVGILMADNVRYGRTTRLNTAARVRLRQLIMRYSPTFSMYSYLCNPRSVTLPSTSILAGADVITSDVVAPELRGHCAAILDMVSALVVYSSRESWLGQQYARLLAEDVDPGLLNRYVGTAISSMVASPPAATALPDAAVAAQTPAPSVQQRHARVLNVAYNREEPNET